LILSFLLKDIDENDNRNEILIPAVTWPTQIWSPMIAGFNVKLVDVDPNTLNIDYNDLLKKITDNTRAIFIVHLMGNPCNMDTILNISKQYNIEIIEDCCEALGAEFNNVKVGNFGLGGTTSFFFSHHITTMEGGMIMCQSKKVADRIRVLRAHGWTRNVKYNIIGDIDPRYAFVNWGFNLRPTELQAGFGLKQLERFPIFSVKRNQLANMFYNWINSTEWLSKPIIEKNSNPSWLGLPIMIKDDAPFSAKQITKYLENEGIETRPIVTGNVARHPAAKKFNLVGNFPGADKVHNNGFYIGLSPMQTIKNMVRLIECFNKFVGVF
jgi:CDP-6-deoxy-D-xylo-4-hexulose-3-dehydrase